MNETVLEALNLAGVDVKGAVARFAGNDALYLKFLKKLPADDNFAKIKPALDAGDMETALTAAHTLKGVSGNLSVDRLYKASSDMVSRIREKNYEEAAASYGELEAAYQDICGVLKEFGEEI